jgi:hypothetical protein
VIRLGVYIDPRVVYDLTPQEINAVLVGISEREKSLQYAENVRLGTLCASVYNSRRQKRSDKVWKWEDFFKSDMPRKTQSDRDMKSIARNFMIRQNATEAKK